MPPWPRGRTVAAERYRIDWAAALTGYMRAARTTLDGDAEPNTPWHDVQDSRQFAWRGGAVEPGTTREQRQILDLELQQAR